MRLDSSSPMAGGFVKVKQAFESTYACLGITCADVGGIVSGTHYYESAWPCATSAAALGSTAPVGAVSSKTATTTEMTAVASQGSDTDETVLYVAVAFAITIFVLLGLIAAIWKEEEQA